MRAARLDRAKIRFWVKSSRLITGDDTFHSHHMKHPPRVKPRRMSRKRRQDGNAVHYNYDRSPIKNGADNINFFSLCFYPFSRKFPRRQVDRDHSHGNCHEKDSSPSDMVRQEPTEKWTGGKSYIH